MKIVHVTKKYPAALGGDATVVANLKNQQQKANHKVVVVTSNCDEIAGGEHIHKLGFKDTPAGLDTITFKRLISLLVLSYKIFVILGKERPDVIHTHSVDMAFFVSFAARWYGIPIVHTFHIVTFYDTNQSALRRKSELWLAKEARLRSVTAPNIYDVKKLQTAGLGQAVLLPNGIDLDSWEVQGYTEKNREFTFVAIGRLERQKGYEYLIKAAALLAKTPAVAFHVIIAGEGSQMAALRKLAHALHVEDIISIVGRKNQRQIHTLLSEADAAVLPSLYETTPLTLLEAWSAAVPVIMTPVGILRDVPDDFDAAFMVPMQDEHALMKAMDQCMTDKDRRLTVAANGHEEVKKYTWTIIGRAAEGIYRDTQ